MSDSARPDTQFTSVAERRLIAAARAGDAAAQAQLLERYEPMIRRLTRGRFVPRGDREDLAQEGRLGVVRAIASWDPRRRVPFRAFAWLCASREIRDAEGSARAEKHRPLNTAWSMHRARGEETGFDDGHARAVGQGRHEDRLPQIGRVLEDALALTGSPDTDPVAKLLGRERLAEILVLASRLTALERGAISLSLNDRSRRDSARALGVGERAVTNALQRGRHKLAA